MEKHINLPLTDEQLKDLKVGDFVYLSGVIYTARDAAHARLVKLIENGEEFPFELEGAFIYYVGPTPTKPGEVIGSCGPTTSYRMDAYTPLLLDNGLKGMIGKGKRSPEVIESMKKNTAVYFAGVGGAAAITAKAVISNEIVCYEDLGAEAIRRLEIKDMPLVVAVDSDGGNIFEIR